MQYSPAILASDPHELAIAALTVLGADLAAMRGRATQLLPDTVKAHPRDGTKKPRERSRSSTRSRRSASSRSTARSSRTRSSCSSTKSLSKASKSKRSKAKVKSTASKAASSKAGSVGSTASKRRTVVTVAPHPKPEKYVPPPRGTFRTSYTRHLRSEVIGAFLAEIEALGMPESVPLISNHSGDSGIQGPSSTTSTQQLAIRPPLATLSRSTQKLELVDLPVLAVAEFDFFSASRARSTDIRETSGIWSRSPAAPAPPKVRRWLKNARIQPIGTIEEIEEAQILGISSEDRGK